MRQAITRFAPSPTGHLHIGGLRTALFNYFQARKTNGKFLIRIEDTDKKRSEKRYEKAILEALEWLGISYTPPIYRQSERLYIYKEYAKKLLREGKAYRCFCGEERLKALKESALKRGAPPRYDGHCRKLSSKEIEERISKGEKYTIRLKIPKNEEIIIKDLVQGEVVFNTKDLDDFIIVRSDGMPLYNFAVSIDDALMGINLIIRGVSHLSNTPKQILILRALGFEIPEFAHVSEIIQKDGKKLSKREGAEAIEKYRSMGILPSALINYVMLLGWYPKDGNEIKTVEEIAKEFDIKDSSKSPSMYDFEKLLWINKKHIQILGKDKLFEYVKNEFNIYLEESEKNKALIFEIAKQVNLLSKVEEKLKDFLNDDIEIPKIVYEHQEFIKSFYEILKDYNDFSSPKDVVSFFKEKVFPTATRFQLKGKELYRIIRLMITGKEEGMELDLLFWFLGKEKLLKRLSKII